MKKQYWLTVIIIATLVLWFIITNMQETESTIFLTEDQIKSIPAGPVHWHPKLTIRIDGKEVNIPTGIGISIGTVVDTRFSTMRMSPTHTHETDGTIHIENQNPAGKPETVTLGYLFYIWNKPFNSTCILDHCTGKIRMTVNGKENKEFQNYVMHDKDDIVLEYTKST